MKRRNYSLFLAFVLLILFFSSCHSKYAVLSYSLCKYPTWNSDSTALAFMLLNEVSQPPTGLGKFPDGGTHKSVYKNLSLYYYGVKERKIKKIANFDDIIDFKSVYSKYFRTFLIQDTNKIYFKFSKLERWYNYDSTNYLKTKNKYIKPYFIELNSRKMIAADTSYFRNRYKKIAEKNKKEYPYSQELIREIPLKKLGLDLKKIYPQSKRVYLNYFIYQRGNQLIRMAIWQQVIPTISKHKIKRIMIDMDDYRAKLTDKSQSSYNNKQAFVKFESYYNTMYYKLDSLYNQ